MLVNDGVRCLCISCQNSSADECWSVWMSLLNAACRLHHRGDIYFFQKPTLLTTDVTVDALMTMTLSVGHVMMMGVLTRKHNVAKRFIAINIIYIYIYIYIVVMFV